MTDNSSTKTTDKTNKGRRARKMLERVEEKEKEKAKDRDLVLEKERERKFKRK